MFAETYNFSKPITAEQIVTRIVMEGMKKMDDGIRGWRDRAKELGLTPYQALTLASIIEKQTAKPEERDILYFLSQSFRAQLIKELPAEAGNGGAYRDLAYRSKALLKDLSAISLEMAQMVVAEGEKGDSLPGWFMVEIVRDLPRLVEKRNA